jgi:hypothetical protein
MVELTYPVLLDTIRTLGIIVGISYYVLTLRNQQKSQKHAEDTRKIQLLHNLNRFFVEGHSNLSFYQMMNMEWENYDDFKSKYSFQSNPEFYDEWIRLWRNMNYNGLIMNAGLIDASTYVQYSGDYSPIIWSKFKPIIEEMRLERDNPELFIGFEILANEVDRYRQSRGLKPRVSIDVSFFELPSKT